MSKEENQIFIHQLGSLTFQDNIDNVYECIFNQEIFKKSLIFENCFEIEISSYQSLYIPYSKFRITSRKYPEYKLKMEVNESINKKDYKLISHKVMECGDTKFNALFIIKYELFTNSCENTTVMSSEIEYNHPEQDYINKFIESIPPPEKLHYSKELSTYLNNKKKKISQVDSIVINRPIKQIWDTVINTEELFKLISIKHNHRVCQVGENGKKGTILHFINTNNNLSSKYILKKVDVKEDERKLVYMIDKNDSNQKSFFTKIQITIVKLSSASSILLLHKKYSFFMLNSMLYQLSQFTQLYLKEIKNKLESTFCYEE